MIKAFPNFKRVGLHNSGVFTNAENFMHVGSHDLKKKIFDSHIFIL